MCMLHFRKKYYKATTGKKNKKTLETGNKTLGTPKLTYKDMNSTSLY